MWSRIKNYLWLLLMLGGIALTFRLQTEQRDSPHTRTRTEKKARSEFVTLHDARLVGHRDNDGDSFHIVHDGGEDHEFRLYFVDAPEKRLHQFNGQRLEEQARYFGKLSVSQAVGIGLEAKAFTDHLLKHRHFTLQTRWQRVFDSGRYFALVMFDEGDGRTEDLSEKLVRAGLCRIYTKGANLPDGRHEKEFEQHLRELEREAKARRQGAWRF